MPGAIEVDESLVHEIFDRIATTELGLEQVLAERKSAELPIVSSTTIYKWLSENNKLAEYSARARKWQAELLHDRAQMAAQQPLIGKIEKTVETEKGIETTVTVSDNVERSKLIVQTMLKRAGQLDSKKYGDKIQAEHSGEVQLGVQLVHSVPRPEREEK